MTLPVLSVIPAGAGSGKTYTIQQRLAQWIRDERVRPERIIAVTFTEAAAGELRERIRTELLRQELGDAALRLERAAICTIHSFGLAIVTDYCFEAGISPAPRLLSEDEEDRLIRLAVAETDRADAVLDNLAGFGYRYDVATGASAEEQFRRRVLTLINVLRTIGHDARGAALAQYACDYIEKTYGPCNDAGTARAALQAAAGALLDAYPDDWPAIAAGNKSAADDFRRNRQDLLRARDGAELDRDWALWQRLRSLRTSGRGVALPDAYLALARRVMDAAQGVLRHPGPREQALVHVRALFGAAEDALARHGDAKREAALLDYTDMLAIAARMLRRDPRVMRDLAARMDCLVVDEFQDTNPLQFSLLWMLHGAGVPALIVGDRKQAIMRFQHADARLMGALEKQHPGTLQPLRENWRTRADLLDWMNAVAAGLFGAAYRRLTPRADFPSSMQALEIVDWRAKGRTNVAPGHMALRIHALLNDPAQQCFDSGAQGVRRLRGEDIAVLCPTRSLLDKYAEALRGLGLRVRLEQPGWFESRIVQLVCNALAYLADPHDVHACLYLAVTELGGHTLESALRRLVDGQALEDPLFERLARAADGGPDRGVATLLDDLIEALDLYAVCGRWPGGRQARANLLKLRALACTFAETDPESLAGGGYYGGAIKVFLAWALAQAERDNTQPDPRVVDEQAIYLTTWHGAKGREWPVVAVCGIYRPVAPRLPDIDVQYPAFTDLEKILPRARVQYAPAFEAPEIAERFSEPLRPLCEDDAKRLLYVVLTRAREKVILEWPSHLAGKEPTTYWSVLRDNARMVLAGEVLRVGDRTFPAMVTTGGKTTPARYDELAGESPPSRATGFRQSIAPGRVAGNLTPESIAPSVLAGEPLSGRPPVETHRVAPALDLDLALAGIDRGALLHRCMEAMRGDAARAGLLDAATGHAFTVAQRRVIARTVVRFEKWLADRFSPTAIEREVPVLGLDAHGSVIAGAIDLLVDTPDGYWIIDYKSDRAADATAQFKHYLPQLMAYVEALSTTGDARRVLGVAVYWLSTGMTTIARVA